MSRLPYVGEDTGDWGAVLNDFLSQSHAADGSLLVEAVAAALGRALSDVTVGSTGQASLRIAGSYMSDDIAGGTDSTGRLETYNYQRASLNRYGESVRHNLMRQDAKAMHAWRVPVAGYDASRNAIGDPDAAGGFQSVAWCGAHVEANAHDGLHMHWEVEVPDSTGQLQGRLEVRFGDPATGAIGLDKTLIATSQADLIVRCDDGSRLGVSAAAGVEKALIFANSADAPTANQRFKIGVTADAETGGNLGSNFRIVRYADDGVTALDAPFYIGRKTANVGLLGVTSQFGGGTGVIGIKDAVTPPGSNPTGGGVLYSEGGALKWRGSSGTVTVLGAA